MREKEEQQPASKKHLIKKKSIKKVKGKRKHRVKKLKNKKEDFPGGAVVKNPPASAGDTGSSPGPGRSHMPRSS